MSKGRKKRQYYTGEKKVSILKRHLVEREDVSVICEELKLHPTVFYEWQRKFFENGVKAFESEEKQESKQLRDKVEALEAKLKRKDSAMAELVEELIAEKKEALRGIEWVKLVFPDVNMLVQVNVNVPEKEWSHALKAKFRKHGTNPCKQNLSGAIFVRGEVAKSVKQIKEGPTLHDDSSCH